MDKPKSRKIAGKNKGIPGTVDHANKLMATASTPTKIRFKFTQNSPTKTLIVAEPHSETKASDHEETNRRWTSPILIQQKP